MVLCQNLNDSSHPKGPLQTLCVPMVYYFTFLFVAVVFNISKFYNTNFSISISLFMLHIMLHQS